MRETSTMPDPLEAGREAFGREAWTEAYQTLTSAPPGLLEADDFERLAVASYLIGNDAASEIAWEDAHRSYLAIGDPEDAARCCFWLALCLLLRGEMAQAGGWLGRAETIVESAGVDCAARGLPARPRVAGRARSRRHDSGGSHGGASGRDRRPLRRLRRTCVGDPGPRPSAAGWRCDRGGHRPSRRGNGVGDSR